MWEVKHISALPGGRALCRGRRAALLGLALVVLVAGACDRTAHPSRRRPVRKRTVIRSFTDASPVRVLAAAKPYAFAATDDGLDQFHLESGERLHLSRSNGLPGDRILSLDFDHARQQLWIATNGGVARYDIRSAAVSVALLPEQIGAFDLQSAAVAAGPDGGAWVGLPEGLFRVDHNLDSRRIGEVETVTALHRAPGGGLLVATEQELLRVDSSGAAEPVETDDACYLAGVDFFFTTPDGSVAAVGDNEWREQRIVFFADNSCVAYRSSPDHRWISAVVSGRDLVVLTDRKLFIWEQEPTGAQLLARDGMRLLPVSPGVSLRSPRLSLRPFGAAVPPGAEALAAVGGEILVGTRALGTVRVAKHGGDSESWLRRRELTGEATGLSVACSQPRDCYVATGGAKLWHFDGEQFRDVGDGAQVVFAVLRGPGGQLYALRRLPEHEAISVATLSRLTDGLPTWVDREELTLHTPGVTGSVSFARFSPGGILWVGVQYLDADGQLRPFGVARVNPALGVIDHHILDGAISAQQVGTPFSGRALGATFSGSDETWLATTEGLAHVAGGAVQVHRYEDGWPAQFGSGIACAESGVIYLASARGVAVFDGASWRLERRLRGRINDLQLGPGGRLWIATDRGLAMFDGTRVHRLDVRRGLLENRIQDLEIDHFGRVWVRGDQGLALVAP